MVKSQNVIILHGWGSNPDRWGLIRDQLQSSLGKIIDTKFYVPYLPGFDPDNPISKPYTIKDYGSWLDQYIKKNKIDKPAVVGHSNGGRIAIFFSSRHPEKISKLILIDSAGIPNKNHLKIAVFYIFAKIGKKTLALFGKKTEKLWQNIFYRIARESDYLKASPVMKKTMQNLLQYNAENDLKNIISPTLIIWGKKDTTTPIWMGQKMTKLIPKANLNIISCGHNPHIEAPFEIAKIIRSFLNNK